MFYADVIYIMELMVNNDVMMIKDMEKFYGASSQVKLLINTHQL